MPRPTLSMELPIDDMTLGDLRAFLSFAEHLPDDTNIWLNGDHLDPQGRPLALAIDNVQEASAKAPSA